MHGELRDMTISWKSTATSRIGQGFAIAGHDFQATRAERLEKVVNFSYLFADAQIKPSLLNPRQPGSVRSASALPDYMVTTWAPGDTRSQSYVRSAGHTYDGVPPAGSVIQQMRTGWSHTRSVLPEQQHEDIVRNQ
jgi:hypothetical protein